MLRYYHGLEQEDYDRMLASQNGVCAICKEPEKAKKYLAVDHCHTTGKIRGLLCCTHCNTALGSLRDNVSLFLRAIDYLEAA